MAFENLENFKNISKENLERVKRNGLTLECNFEPTNELIKTITEHCGVSDIGFGPCFLSDLFRVSSIHTGIYFQLGKEDNWDLSAYKDGGWMFGYKAKNFAHLDNAEEEYEKVKALVAEKIEALGNEKRVIIS